MSHSHQTTNLHNAYVYHKLTEKQGKAWCLPEPFGSNVRRQMASQLAKMYPTNGCGVCSATMKLVAYVSPRAELRLLTAPFKLIPIALIANKPAPKDCPCFDFIDTEIRGPWRLRPEHERQRAGWHHPMCQYQRTGQAVFETLYRAKNGGVRVDDQGVAHRQGSRVAVRPDLMIQVQRKLLDR
jgi:hypothetical protein